MQTLHSFEAKYIIYFKKELKLNKDKLCMFSFSQFNNAIHINEMRPVENLLF